MGSGDIAPRIRNLGNRWRWVVSFTPWPLYPQGKGGGWAPEPFWTRWWREKFPAPAGTRTPDNAGRSPELFRFPVKIQVDVSKDYAAFIFRVTSVSYHGTKRRHHPKELDLNPNHIICMFRPSALQATVKPSYIGIPRSLSIFCSSQVYT
jgi:hypothetical protein